MYCRSRQHFQKLCALLKKWSAELCKWNYITAVLSLHIYFSRWTISDNVCNLSVLKLCNAYSRKLKRTTPEFLTISKATVSVSEGSLISVEFTVMSNTLFAPAHPPNTWDNSMKSSVSERLYRAKETVKRLSQAFSGTRVCTGRPKSYPPTQRKDSDPHGNWLETRWSTLVIVWATTPVQEKECTDSRREVHWIWRILQRNLNENKNDTGRCRERRLSNII